MTRALLALALVLSLSGAQATPQPPPWLVLMRSHLGTNPGHWKEDQWWCSEEVATVIPGPHKHQYWHAFGWKNWGRHTEPRLGAVVIMQFKYHSPGNGHLGLLNGSCGETYCPIISGNMTLKNGKKGIRLDWINKKWIKDMRWPEWAV